MLTAGVDAVKFTGGGFDIDPLQAYEALRCEPERKVKRVRYESGYCNEEMDGLLNAAAVEIDPEKRRKLIKQIVTRANADVSRIAIGYAPRIFAFRDYVKGFTTSSSGDFRPWGGGLNHVWLDK